MEKVPILKLDKSLIVTLRGDITDKMAVQFQMDILEKVYNTKALGVLIDISTLDIVDSFLGRVISETAQMVKLLGAETVLSGMKPGVAMTLIDLGVDIKSVTNSLTLEQGMQKLSKLIKEETLPVHDSSELLGEEENDYTSN